MPRRAAAQIRPVEPDPVHRSRLVQQVINKVMLDGKKSTAERIVYDALAIMAERTGREPVEALENSIKTLTPVLEVRSRRGGGAPPPPVRGPAPPGPRGGAGPPPSHAGRPLARRFPPPAPREDDGPAPRE